MKHSLHRTIGAGAAIGVAQDAGKPHQGRANGKPPAPPPAAAAQPQKLPQRAPFTAADDAAAVVPGMPDARFWADSVTVFEKALPAQRGPWLILSTGGADGAFGAGLLNG